jgi:hypothetical protein
MDVKLIELVSKCEELHEMSNKKYSDSVWKEKPCGEIGEELKKSGTFQCFYSAFLSYYHSIITKVLVINKQRKMHSVAVVEYG